MPVRALARLALIALGAAPAGADTVVLTLDEDARPPDLECHRLWAEAGVELEVVPTSLERCGLSLCNINLPASPVSLVLVPGQLEMDLSAIPGTVHTVEAVVSTVIPDFEKLCLYDGDVMVACEVAHHTFPEDTVRVASAGAPVTRAAWEPCLETSVFEVLVHFDPEPTAAPLSPVLPARADRLLSPRPHPLRTAGALRFVLANRARAGLTVHDATGSLVRELGVERRASGAHEVPFDGRGDDGLPLPAGVYFARLVVNGRAADTGRIVVLR